MPECHENTIGNKICQKFIEEQVAQSRILTNVFTDITGNKACLCGANSNACPASEGHVHTLLSSYPTLSGKNGTPLYPCMYSTEKDDVPIARRGLLLEEAQIDARNYILRFVDKNKRECWFQLQPLTHTVVQIYNKEDWDGAITCVAKNIRGFKVALAFQFKNHVMAFVSQDLLFKVFWERSRADLPVQFPDIYLNPIKFLEDLIAWMFTRRGGRGTLKRTSRTQNALLVVREAPQFHGVGLYTVSELWHMAGLPPSLTEEELLDSPSRLARLCAAYYHFAHIGHNELWEFTKKHMKDYVVAIHMDERKSFSKFLHVWGQDRSYLSERHHALLQNYEKTGFDPFEPQLIHHAFRCTAVNFGPLIFGQELWKKLSDAEELPTLFQNINPLSKFFSNINAKKSGLSPSAYVFLFHRADIQRPLARNWTPTFCYRAGSRDVWSIHPALSYPFDPVLGEDREKRLLRVVTQYQNIYTVGPLDYCGIGKLVRGRGQDVLLVCEFDPRHAQFYIKRRAFAKETAKLKGKGSARSGVKSTVKRNLMANIPVCTPASTSSSTDQAEERPAKRLRRSSDQDISIPISMAHSSGTTDGCRVTRSKSRIF